MQVPANDPDRETIKEKIRCDLGISDHAWLELADCLNQYDGEAAAERLARLGRFGDAAKVTEIQRPVVAESKANAGVVVVIDPDHIDSCERPRLDPKPEDVQKLFDLFGGAEHAFLRDIRVGERIDRERVMQAPTVRHVREHLDGVSDGQKAKNFDDFWW